MNPAGHCTTIPADKAFINVLARWILAQYGQDAQLLTRTLVLLPNRRMCRSLREAFLECTGGKPLLLPKIQPIGDGEDESIVHQPPPSVPPPMAPMRRELLLAREVMAFRKQGSKSYFSVEQSTELARQLARFIDEVVREGLSLDHLSRLVPEDLAKHWQQTLDFLAIISRQWPSILEKEGASDAAAYRNALLTATSEAWKKQPPAYPVIAAGSTGSIPATARLLATIARLPQGMVVLPGLDTDMEDAQWEMIADTHPQAGLKHLLSTLGLKRRDISLLEGETQAVAPRVAALREIVKPAEATSGWMQADAALTKGLEGIRLLVADTQHDEARMIAIALREVLETPEKTAALVTPDRTLARMVASQMERFGVTIDDSAGRALTDSPPGVFLRLLAEMIASHCAPVPLLAVLRHPLAAAGGDPAECRRLSRLLETALLRGMRPAPGLAPLADAAADKDLKALLTRIDERLRPLQELLRSKSASLDTLLNAHITFAEWLATPERLWAGEEGNALAAFFAGLAPHASVLPPIDPAAYPGVFDTLLAGQMYWPRFSLHPRLHILSPIEARLQRFDRIILGSLNEGTWPAAAVADPWMSRPMREAFGLPSAERAIGQSAHDITLLAAAPEVILSRARKVEGAPTVPSRWLVRLSTLVGGIDADALEAMHAHGYEQAKRWLDAPLQAAPLSPPAPVPPLNARPREMAVTAIDRWLRDPYVIYAQYILRLRKLLPLDQEPDALDFGNVVHKALEFFALDYPDKLPANAYEELLHCGDRAFAELGDRPAVACLWKPRFAAMAHWLMDEERTRRNAISSVQAELKGKLALEVGGKPFTLNARIDRMELAEGGAVIADYKTGSVPREAEVDEGTANQLPLGALVALKGVLTPAVAAPSSIAAMEYWKLSANPDDCEVTQAGSLPPEELIARAEARLRTLIARFDQAATPYAAQTDPRLTLSYSDFEHLTRREEWESA